MAITVELQRVIDYIEVHLTVRATDEAIAVDFHTLTYRLHQKDEAYELVSPWNRRFPATLSRNEEGTPIIAIGFEPATAAITFTREGR